jgi:hypothetical protein
MENKLTKEVLDIRLGADYERGDYTLRDELERFYNATNEDLEFINYQLCGPPGEESSYFYHFLCYSKNFVLTLTHDVFNATCLIWLPRNPNKNE